MLQHELIRYRHTRESLLEDLALSPLQNERKFIKYLATDNGISTMLYRGQYQAILARQIFAYSFVDNSRYIMKYLFNYWVHMNEEFSKDKTKKPFKSNMKILVVCL